MQSVLSSDLRDTLGDVLNRVEHHGEAFEIRRYRTVIAELHPAGTAHRIHRLEAGMDAQHHPPETLDPDSRAEFIHATLARLRALVGDNTLEGIKLLNELEAKLLNAQS